MWEIIKPLVQPFMFLAIAILAGLIMDAFTSMILNLIGETLKQPTPMIFDADGNLNKFPVEFIKTHTMWYAAFFFIVSIIIAGMRMMFSKSNYRNFKFFIRGIIVYAVVVGSTVNCIVLSIKAGDEFSKWIIDQVGDVALFNGASFSSLIGDALDGKSFVLFIISILGIVMAIIEWIISYSRAAILGLLVALLPLASAITTITIGFNYLKRYLSWIISFILYKPISAIIFSYTLEVYKMSGQDSSSIDGYFTTTMYVIALLFVSLITLPTIVKLLTPINSPFDSSGATAMSMVGLAAGLALTGGSGAAAETGAAAARGGGAEAGGGASGAMNIGDGGGSSGGNSPGGGGNSPGGGGNHPPGGGGGNSPGGDSGSGGNPQSRGLGGNLTSSGFGGSGGNPPGGGGGNPPGSGSGSFSGNPPGSGFGGNSLANGMFASNMSSPNSNDSNNDFSAANYNSNNSGEFIVVSDNNDNNPTGSDGGVVNI